MHSSLIPANWVRRSQVRERSCDAVCTVARHRRQRAAAPGAPRQLRQGDARCHPRGSGQGHRQGELGIDVVGDAKKAAEAAKQAAQVKTMGQLVPVYLAIRERGDDGWKKLRPKTLGEVTRYLTKTWGAAARRADRQGHTQDGQGPARR